MDIIRHYQKDDTSPTDYIFPLLDSSAFYAKSVSEELKATLPTKIIIKLTDSISSKNALINKYLKKIANKAEINKKISFHISRHSFAKIAKDKGVDNSHLKMLLGHSNIKVKEVYMGNFDTKETDAVMNSIFEKKTDTKEKIKELLKNLDSSDFDKLVEEIRNRRTSNGEMNVDSK
jgi:integrase/recombinase XerD